MTAVADQPTPPGPALPGRPGWSLAGAELLAELDALHQAQTRLAARRLELLHHLDRLGFAGELGARNTVELLALRHRLDPHEVRRDLKTAHFLTRYYQVAGQFPGYPAPPPASATTTSPRDVPTAVDQQRAARVRETALNPGQATAIAETLDSVPAQVRPADVAVAETELVIAARTLAPRDLRRLGRAIVNTLDTDGPPPTDDTADAADAADAGDAARAAQTLWFTPGTVASPTGRVRGLRFGGFLTSEDAELFQTLIDAAAKPRKTPTGQLDPRTLGQRRADALAIILRAAASTGGEIPAHGGIKPHLSVTIPYTDLQATTPPTNAPLTAPAAPATRRLELPQPAQALARPAARPATRPVGARSGPRTGELVYGDPLSAGDVRRIACDAGIIPIVLATTSEPLDVGREHRLVTPALRRALITRDQGCIIPGCGAPPGHCDAHHVTHWADGGPTSLDKLQPY